MGDDWRYRELAKWMEANRGNLLFEDKTIFLVNPATIRRVDEIIKKHFWLAVQRAVAGTGLVVYEGRIKEIETTNAEFATRSVTFLLEDPRRPLSNLPKGEVPPWYCRGKIESSLLDYMLSFDLYIELPISFSIEKIIGLIGDPQFRGLPPELEVGEDPEGRRFYHIAFHSGGGAGFGHGDPSDAAGSIERRVRINVEITKRVDDLYQNLENELAFQKLKTALLEGYEAF